MYFIYFFIICYISILVHSVNTYVVLAANRNDLKSLAKKYVPNKNLVDQIKVMVLETGLKNNNRETLEDDENTDQTIEFLDEEKVDPYELLKAIYKYQPKKPPRVSLLQPQDPSPKTRLTAPKMSTLDELIDKLKHGILQEIIDNSGDDNTQLNIQVNNALAQQLKAVVNKKFQNKPKIQIKNPVPMKVFNKEVQFEGTYEDTTDKNEQPQIHYLGQVQIPTKYLNNKPVKDFSYTKTVVPKKHKFKSPKHIGAGKKVRYVKQEPVPANTNQGVRDNVLQSSLWQQLMKQPSLAQQTNIFKESVLEPKLSLMQQSSEMQLPLDQQPSIIQQLALMQQQIDRLNKIVQQNLAENKKIVGPTPSTNLEAPHVAGEAPFKIVSSSNPEGDEQETDDNESLEDQVLETAEDSLSEEIMTESALHETSTDYVPTTVENEPVIEDVEEEVAETAGKEEDTTITNENDNDRTTETTPEEVTETNSNDEQEKTTDDATTPAETILVKADNAARLEEIPKKHTQEFGNPAAGEPIVEKTYNFNVPIVEPNQESVTLKMPVNSARKVLLF